MTILDDINRILRDHEGYTGDGQGGVGALPVGDRSTAHKLIEKRDLRDVMARVADVALSVTSVPGGTPSEKSPLLMRTYVSSVSTPSEYIRILVPVAGAGYANMLLKRGSISASTADAGTSQVTWEPDQTDAVVDAALVNNTSTTVSGAWVINTLAGGYWTQESNSAGAARSWTFSGNKVRLGYYETPSSASFDIEIDGVVVASVPTGTTTSRRVFEKAGLATGTHTIIARRTATGGGFLRVQGMVIADANGTMEGTGNLLIEGSPTSGGLIQSGVQTFVATVNGGKRMGGGHGGSWLRTPPHVSIDGRTVAIDVTAGEYHAGKAIQISESFELRETSGGSPRALIAKRMTFRANGYDCEMDVRLPSPVAFKDFFWGMAKAGTLMTRLKMPIDAALTTLPLYPDGQIVAFEGGGYRVTVTGDGDIQSTGPDQYAYIADNVGVAKLYNTAAQNEAHTFTGRQRLRYSVDFAGA